MTQHFLRVLWWCQGNGHARFGGMARAIGAQVKMTPDMLDSIDQAAVTVFTPCCVC